MRIANINIVQGHCLWSFTLWSNISSLHIKNWQI